MGPLFWATGEEGPGEVSFAALCCVALKGRAFVGKLIFTRMGVRHKKPSKSPLEAVGKPAIRRLARRGGVARISAEVYQSMRDTANAYLDSVVERALLYLECRVGKNGGVLTATDVIYALKSTTHGGVTFYSDVP